ncbi:MAG: sodium:solute symporter family protein, partial [Oscillospiraceae bacterium]|nr:sodium:solute symporter family protein [Oscillospiraceae bacterium]
SILLVIVMLAVGLSQMVAAGKLGENLLGLKFTPVVLVFAVLFIVYTLAGGMNAVASTNKMHIFAMYGGVVIGVIFALVKVGGFGELMHFLDEGNISDVTKEAVAAATTAVPQQQAAGGYLGMLTIGFSRVSSWIIASLLGACTAQAGIQPVLAAKDVHTAKKACVITALVTAPFGIFTALLGMASKAMFNKGEMLYNAEGALITGKDALPTLMTGTYLHDNSLISGVVGGLVLAAILAAIISTVSPIILSAGTMVTKDLYQRVLRPKASDKQVLFVSRVVTAISGVICAVAAIALVDLSAVLDIVYAAYSLRGAIFVVVLLGIYWKKASEKGACWSMVLTGVVAVFWKVYDIVAGSYPVADWITETYAAVAVAFVATIIFSYVFPKRQLKTT